ncbi:hypothetical protein GPJ56_006963 [Histomonas meleagridis]|nr:hypothetical protein GPJ56_006963 [Histomonas meleagridis]
MVTAKSNHIITYNNIYNVTSSYYIVSDSSEKIGITITLTSLIDNYISDETFFCISNNTIITFSESLISDEIQRLNSSRIIINNCKFEDSENMRTNYFLNTIYCEAPIEVIDENVLLNRLSNEEVILLIVVCVAVVAELAEVLFVSVPKE